MVGLITNLEHTDWKTKTVTSENNFKVYSFVLFRKKSFWIFESTTDQLIDKDWQLP